MTDKTDKVGYKNPPKHTRFKKGQSGNPKGRPKKKQASLVDMVGEILGEKAVASINGKPVSMDQKEVLVRKLLQKALTDDLNALKYLMPLIDEVEKKSVKASKKEQPIVHAGYKFGSDQEAAEVYNQLVSEL